MNQLTHRESIDLFRSPPTRLVDVGHGAVAVRSVGEGPDVLFVHGWPMNGATFRGLLPHLVPHARCHVLDLVGAGASRFDRMSRLDLRSHAASVRRVVDELGLDDVAVVGHDSGGLVARLALAGDPRVRAWGLVETELPPTPNWRFRAFFVPRRLPGLEAVLGRALSTRRLRRSRFVLGAAYEDLAAVDAEVDELVLGPLATEPLRRWAVAELLREFDLRLFDELPRLHRDITVPVQMVWGGADVFFPVAQARATLPGFGGPAGLLVVDGGRVFVHEEHPRTVAEALRPTVLDGTVTSRTV